MQVKWKKLLTKLVFFAGVEILLNLPGLDRLADYGEFRLYKNATLTANYLNLA